MIKIERTKTILLIALCGLALLVAGVGGVWLARPLMLRGGMGAVLERAGFLEPRIEKVERLGRGAVAFDGVRLDREGFSTVERMILTPNIGAEGQSLTLDRVVLTMGWDDLSGASTQSGWVRPASLGGLMQGLMRNDIRAVTLNSGQLDIALPLFGLVRLEAKGQATVQDDGSIRLQSTLWTTQHSVSMELRLSGEIVPGGMASFDAEIHSGKITLPHLSATRLGGWAILNRDDATAPWHISAQIVAGMMQAFHIPVNSLTLTAEGTSDSLHLNLQGGGRESDMTALSMESILRSGGDTHMAMALRIDDRDSVIRYLNGAVTAHDITAEREWLHGALRRGEDKSGFEFDLHNAEAGRLAAFIGLSPPLDITGTLGGLLKLRRDERGMLRVDHGMVRNHRGGTIASGLNTLPEGIDTGDSNRDEITRLLQSLRYDSIEIFVEGTVQDSLHGDITINGRDSSDTPALVHIGYRL